MLHEAYHFELPPSVALGFCDELAAMLGMRQNEFYELPPVNEQRKSSNRHAQKAVLTKEGEPKVLRTAFNVCLFEQLFS